MELNQIISKDKIQKYHKDFERTKSSKIIQFFVFYRMHFNRIIQNASIILSNPFIWRYIIQGFFRAARGKRCLRSLEVAITYRCNAKCEQCSCRIDYDKDGEKNKKLTIDEFKNAIDQAIEMGAFQFSINGGEPMLEEETVFELISYIKKHRKRFVMLCTNGMLLNEQKIYKLKECGLDGIEMGIDSAFEQKHDNNRIKGSYKKIFENIRYCKKYGIHVSLNTILTNDKIQKDDIIYTFLLAKKLGCLLQITPCCLTGGFKNRLDLLLTEEAKLYFFWLLSKTWNNRSDMYSSLTIIKCPAAREKIGLQPYGDVVSCPLIQIKYGNIRQKSLEDIQSEMLKNPYYHLNKMQGCLPAMSESFIREYLLDK
jgi:MoaA/NifB/PqqE/SkfB family radical SAM enzyme